MTNSKSTKRALFGSCISLLLCFTMLLGTTFAWFTDSAVSANNVITAGNLDIDVQYTLDGTTWKNLDGAEDLFQKGLWEPGHTEVVALKIENKGSLALKYNANMNIVEETVGKTKDGKDIVLSDILQVSTFWCQYDDGIIGQWMMEGYFGSDNPYNTYYNTASFKDSNVLGKDIELVAGDANYFIIKVDMPETVGNEANAKDKESVPSIKFGINVLATQQTAEYDSFGKDYDADAEYDDFTAVSNADELKTALAKGGNVLLTKDIALDVNGKAMTVAAGADVLIDLNGNDIVGTTTVSGASQVLFEVKGELTVVGDGTIALYDESGAAFDEGHENAAIYVNGGTANLNGGEIVCTSNSGAMAYAADAVGGNSVINVNGATLRSSYIGIRSFPTASGKTNTINYNSGVVCGEKNGYDIWTQEGNGKSEVNIAEGIAHTYKDEWGGMYYID